MMLLLLLLLQSCGQQHIGAEGKVILSLACAFSALCSVILIPFLTLCLSSLSLLPPHSVPPCGALLSIFPSLRFLLPLTTLTELPTLSHSGTETPLCLLQIITGFQSRKTNSAANTIIIILSITSHAVKHTHTLNLCIGHKTGRKKRRGGERTGICIYKYLPPPHTLLFFFFPFYL